MNLNEIKKLVELFESLAISELEIEEKGVRIKLKKKISPPVSLEEKDLQLAQRSGDRTSVQVTQKNSSAEGQRGHLLLKELESKGNIFVVKSPMVGTFYAAPSPEAQIYVKEGDFIEKGQVLCIVEAMKLMNEIESEVKGKVVAVLKKNSQAVEYGESLFYVELES